MTEIQPFSDAVRAKLVKATSRAIYTALAEIQANAVNLAPIDQSHLRNSAYIDAPTAKGTTVGGRVSFPMVYAAVQHENEDFNHPKGGEAKYLEKAAERAAPRIAKMIERGING